MAYNHRKAELEWLNWKEKEEKQLRELEVNEDVIQRLHTYDWQQFNKERRVLQRWKDEAPSGEILHKNHVREIHSADELLDEIENEKLFVLLNTVDRLTLEILVLRMHGYSSKDISAKMHLTVNAINQRLYKLKKKLKKFL